MRSHYWTKIENVWHDALKLPVSERSAFVEAACGPDQASREEVESLLTCRMRAESFLGTPALAAAAEFCEFNQDELAAGTVLDKYTIRREIGSGGMGRVYLAYDGSLKRQVAIKFLPSCLEANDLARRRLIVEAQLLAGLDHPNICSVHEINQRGERSFIAMQYVDGATLADRISRDRPSITNALDIAVRIAEAVAFAHSRGIIHRDIKPHNVIITPVGEVKVLDFGVAKIMQPGAADLGALGASDRSDPCQFARLSATGAIIGTAPYMSPEQASGGIVDSRTGLVSLGTLLYESITGTPPFRGPTEAKVLDKVRNFDPPPPSQLNPEVRLEIDALVAKAMSKDPEARHQSAIELLQHLQAVKRLM